MNKIKIIDNKNTELDAEVIMTFGSNTPYIVYKIKNDYFIAKYSKKDNKYQIDTNNISEDIISYGEKLINQYIKEV